MIKSISFENLVSFVCTASHRFLPAVFLWSSTLTTRYLTVQSTSDQRTGRVRLHSQRWSRSVQTAVAGIRFLLWLWAADRCLRNPIPADTIRTCLNHQCECSPRRWELVISSIGSDKRIFPKSTSYVMDLKCFLLSIQAEISKEKLSKKKKNSNSTKICLSWGNQNSLLQEGSQERKYSKLPRKEVLSVWIVSWSLKCSQVFDP